MLKKIITTFIILFICNLTIYSQTSESNVDSIKESYGPIEVMPEYPGGTNELMKYLQLSVQYPEDAIENRIEGKVYVKFIVDQNGEVQDPVIALGIYPSIDGTAIAIVKAMPKWIPGTQNGKPVDVFYTVPIFFSLEGVKKKKK